MQGLYRHELPSTEVGSTRWQLPCCMQDMVANEKDSGRAPCPGLGRSRYLLGRSAPSGYLRDGLECDDDHCWTFDGPESESDAYRIAVTTPTAFPTASPVPCALRNVAYYESATLVEDRRR